MFLLYVQSFSCSAIYIFDSNLCGLHLHGHIRFFRKELLHIMLSHSYK